MFKYIYAFVACFLDTFGISGFATMNFYFKEIQKEDIENIPAYLNMFFCLPTILQAVLFITLVGINVKTLVILTLGGVLGSYLGVKSYVKADAKVLKMIMAVGLFFTALLMLYTTVFPYSGIIVAGNLSNIKLVIGFVFMFLFNMLEAMGIGSYAPSFAVLYFLGMNTKSIFPIITLSSAVDMPAIYMFNYKNGKRLPKENMIMSLVGLVGVLCAVFVFVNINIIYLKYILVVATLFMSYRYARS